MKIFILGVGQVGKSTVGKALAEKLKLKFYDLDFIIIEQYGSIEKFQEKFSDRRKRFKKKANIVREYQKYDDNFVMVVSPIYSVEEHYKLSKELYYDYCYVLTASPETIFERLGFYDEKGTLLEDSDEYKNKYKNYYLRSIVIDNTSNNGEFSFYQQINTDNKTVDRIVEEIIDDIENK